MFSPESIIGAQIDHYRLDQFIARGTVSTVYRASDTVLNRTVALKIIARKTDLTPEMERERKRLAQELIGEARPAHPNILAIHSYGETDELEYMCMEYVRGRTLADILTEKKMMEVGEAAPIFEQVLLALESANQTRIVHRDISPSNIMIREDGRVKVMNLGIAQFPSLVITTTGAVDVPPYYSSPEQISGQKVDIRSDLFSVGAVLFETLTGVKPFQGESTAAIVDKILNTEPPSLRSLNDLIPEPFEGVCGRALSKDPSKRYQTPWEMLKKLRSAASDTTVMEQLPAGIGESPSSVEAMKPKAEQSPGAKMGSAAPGQASMPDALPESRTLSGVVKKPPRESGPPDRRPKGSRSSLGIALLLLIIVGLAIALYFHPTLISENIMSYLGTWNKPPQSGVLSQPSEHQPMESVASLTAQAERIWNSDPSAARGLIERARILDPNNLDPILLFARLLASNGDFAAAAQQYRIALLINNQSPAAFCGLGLCYFNLNNFDLAVENYEACWALAPANRNETITYLGISYFKKNDLGRARALLQQALELNPRNEIARTYLTMISPAASSTSSGNAIPPQGQTGSTSTGAYGTGSSTFTPALDESQSGLPQQPAPPAQSAAPQRADGIRVGMTYQQVRQTFGAPKKIERGNRLIEWEYDTPTGRIEVEFKKGTVHSVRARKKRVRD